MPIEDIEKSKGEDLLAALSSQVDILRFRSAEYLRRYQMDDECKECRKSYQSHLDAEKELKKYLQVLEYAKKNGINSLQNTDNFFCDKLEELKRQINKAEMDLNELRIALISGQAEWYRHEKDRFMQRQKDLQRINNQRAREEYGQEAKLSTALLDKVAKEAQKLEDNIPDGWMEQCLAGTSPVGVMINAEVPKMTLFRNFKIRENCKEAYAKIFATLHQGSRSDMDALMEEARAQAEYQYDNAHFREIYDDPNAEMQHIIDMEQWFTKLELEAECYGQMDQGSAEYKSLCGELSPKLVALRDANKKAHDAYNLRCGRKWQSLQERFQQFTGGHSSADQAGVLINHQ